jgi:hypothetical protein
MPLLDADPDHSGYEAITRCSHNAWFFKQTEHVLGHDRSDWTHRLRRCGKGSFGWGEPRSGVGLAWQGCEWELAATSSVGQKDEGKRPPPSIPHRSISPQINPEKSLQKSQVK